MRLIDADALKEKLDELEPYIDCDENSTTWILSDEVYNIIDNAPAAEEIEEPFITECRNTSIEQNLPLYFVYYEEKGILEVYVTETKELFEKRRCSKHLPDYKFKDAVIKYLDWYSDWKGGAE